MSIEITKLKQIIEAALFASGQPLPLDRLRELFMEDECPPTEMFRAALAEIRTDYEPRGVHLVEVSSGFRFQARQDVGEWVSRLWEEKPQRYSRAMLETLALIAYRQPITRGEVEAVRGVSVNSQIVKTLQERDWIRVVGYRDVPGRPAMFGTTRAFLDYFNLKSLEELPTLAEIRDLEELGPEVEAEAPPTTGQAALDLGVTGDAPEMPATAEPSAPGEVPEIPITAESCPAETSAEMSATEPLSAPVEGPDTGDSATR